MVGIKLLLTNQIIKNLFYQYTGVSKKSPSTEFWFVFFVHFSQLIVVEWRDTDIIEGMYAVNQKSYDFKNIWVTSE